MSEQGKGTSVTIVIFGATGDLTWRKLVPALYNNYRKGRLSECAHVVGFARRPWSNDEFRERLKEGVKQFSSESFDDAEWQEFAEKLVYFHGDLGKPEDYTCLETTLKTLEKGPCNRLYYLATAPEFFVPAVEALGKAGMATEGEGWRRIIIEKPFGTDLASAQALNQAVRAVFDEHQIFRIDHYLGKETAQNILFMRFANILFEPVWNRNYVDHVQISVLEKIDVGERAGFYDETGVVRDMFQNHLLQLLTLVAMESPASFSADDIRNEKVKLLESIRPISLHATLRGQYEGYQDADGVASGSQTPTLAAMKVYIDNWRWQDVPFYLRSGKALAEKASEITVIFRRPPHLMFRLPDAERFTPNMLSLCIQPDDGIHLRIQAKLPDSEDEMQPVDLTFHYRTAFDTPLPDAYERLLLEAWRGDQSLFTRSDAIEAAWRLIDPVLHGWEQSGGPALAGYPKASHGPAQADELISRDCRAWRMLCAEHAHDEKT